MHSNDTTERPQTECRPAEDVVLDISVRRDPEPDWRTIYAEWWDGLNAAIPAALAETRAAA